jgi:pimeloyl-ACP methyl ester carboxylesterase
MKLFFRKTGTGDPLIILHGLYGASDNWYTIGKMLGEQHEVYLVDQRNHGNSPHDPVHTYEAMAGDIYEFMRMHDLGRASFLGHSMGGKAALAFGLEYPEMVNKMIVVDISPFSYKGRTEFNDTSHETIIRALQSLNPEEITDRESADGQLSPYIASRLIRQFLLKNLKRVPGGAFRWALNVRALAQNLPAIYSAVIREEQLNHEVKLMFPLLFIKGENSKYLTKKDEETIRHYFPGAIIEVIQGAGHWVHSEQPENFISVVKSFLRKHD